MAKQYRLRPRCFLSASDETSAVSSSLNRSPYLWVGLGLSLRARWYFLTNPFALGAQTAFIDCLDSIVVVSVKGALFELSAPWSLIQSNHVVVEYKMQRDHLDLQQVIHAETRRSAYHGYLLKREDSVPIGPPALWIVSGYLPEYLRTCRTVSLVSAGVHDLGQVYYQCFWIAANDLPLREELIPFLVARTGKYLEEFVRWVADRFSMDDSSARIDTHEF